MIDSLCASSEIILYLLRLIQSKAFNLDRAAKGSLLSLLSLKSNDLKDEATFLQKDRENEEEFSFHLSFPLPPRSR